MTTAELQVDQEVQPEPAPASPQPAAEAKPDVPIPVSPSLDEDLPVEEKATEPREEIEEDVIDNIVPRAETRIVHLEYAGASRDYAQKPLTYFRKMEFFGLVGDTLESILRDGTVNLNDLIGIDGVSLSGTDIDSFITVIAKVARYAPDFLKDCYVVWLNIPKDEQRWAKEALDQISDEEGVAIIETFLDQNWTHIEDFFTQEVPRLFRRVQDLRKKD